MSCISCIAMGHDMTRRACSDVCVRSPRRACMEPFCAAIMRAWVATGHWLQVMHYSGSYE